MKNYKLPLVLLLFVFAACKNTSKNEVIDETVTVPESTWVGDTNHEYKPGDDELQEFGMIEVIEDGGYPFFIVTVNFVEREMKQDFNLNIEAVTLNMEDLNLLTNKWATIYYTSEVENNLYELQYKGKSVFGENTPEKIDANWKKITGVLSGAQAVTAGDLPDTVTITNEQGETLNFDLFIDYKTVKANGNKVTAYYTIRGVNTITHILPAKK